MDPGLGGERVPLGSSDESSEEELVSPRRDRGGVGRCQFRGGGVQDQGSTPGR